MAANQTKSLQDAVKEQYRKCAQDPVYFMRKYCKIQHPTRGKIAFDLYDFQEGVLNDFKNFSNLVKPGGYIVFDDYMDDIYSPKVKGAVDYIVSELLNDEYVVYGSLIYPEITKTNIDKTSSNEFIIRKKV